MLPIGSMAAMENTTLARIALLAPIPAIVLEPVTASAYFRTKDGKTSGDPSWISAWTTPLQEHLHGAFTWASADTVYLTYGKVFAFAFAGMLCALVALRRQDDAPIGRFRWSWRAATIAYGVALVGIVGEYYTPWTDIAFVALSLPAILLLFIVSPFLGARLLRQRVGSCVGGWMVALTMPAIIGMTALFGHLGFAVIWLSTAWMLHARTLLATTSSVVRQQVPVGAI
ncbi:MAG: hypothetical protein JWO88_180 [Frankiales bacterium]|nr:hypothetical protein [Frankiales bacterium]